MQGIDPVRPLRYQRHLLLDLTTQKSKSKFLSQIIIQQPFVLA
eukprot:SAG31_NODE_1158_length_9605_cov_2.788555_19_plen_42_part_01